MSSNRTEALAIASRYATAIFDLATEAKKEAAIVDEFNTLGAAVAENIELRNALSNPLISRDEKALVVASLASKASPLTKKAVEEIAAGGRAELLPIIADDLNRRLTSQRGELEAVVTSARPLSDAMQKQISDSLAEATGKVVQLQLKEDASVLGGVSIQLGSMRLDATLAGALNTMRSELLAAANRS